MRKVIIFGNSGSGKSTLATSLVKNGGLAHLDLDTIAWLPTTPPERSPITESKLRIDKFVRSNKNWVIEGCYTDLLKIAVPLANEAIFMNLDIDQCIVNSKNRPWEQHKYRSKEEQDESLNMLISWIKQYTERQDAFSFASHMKLFESFQGKKTMHTNNV